MSEKPTIREKIITSAIRLGAVALVGGAIVFGKSMGDADSIPKLKEVPAAQSASPHTVTVIPEVARPGDSEWSMAKAANPAQGADLATVMKNIDDQLGTDKMIHPGDKLQVEVIEPFAHN